jgi:hypothetical protein
MSPVTVPSEEEDSFLRQLVLPVEDRRVRSVWTGSPRWFRSDNVVDLWTYRDRTERGRMIDLAWERRRRQWDGGPQWPP